MILVGCENSSDLILQGKVERETLGVASKIPGRITEIKVAEGQSVQKGDTLAIIDIPEVTAKMLQAEGAVTSAKAQYSMSVKGATDGQLKQLQAKYNALKEQYEFAHKSITRLNNMLVDSLIPQQEYDEAYAKFQGATSQLQAVTAELEEAKRGARLEQQTMALGQQERALGALLEAETAHQERFIIAPQNMSIDVITLNEGELALPGYTLFKGTITESTYFRFTLPENDLKNLKPEQNVVVTVVYNNQEYPGKISTIKPLGAYANIATAYPDYEMQQALFELKVIPNNVTNAKDIFVHTTVLLKL